MRILLVALAGGLGAVCRFVADSAVSRRWRGRAMPVGTLAVNVTGSFVLGVVVGLAARPTGPLSPDVAAVVGTGFCGGYTTFSTASVETIRLWSADGAGAAVRYALTGLVAAWLAAGLGLWLGGLGLGGL